MATTLEELILALEVKDADKAISDINRARQEFQKFCKDVEAQGQKTAANLHSLFGNIGNFGGGGSNPSPRNPNKPPKTSGYDISASSLPGFAGALGSLFSVIGAFDILTGAVSGAASLIKNEFQHIADFAREVSTIKSLTGGSGQDAAKLTNLFRAVGLNATGAEREIEHLSESTRGGSGSQALGALHVSRYGEDNKLKDSARLFSEVTSSLSKMEDGVRKTRLEIALFGSRGALALQPLLRLTDHQRENIEKLSSSFDGRALAAVGEFNASLNILGETFEQRLVFPILEKVLPALDFLVEKMTDFVNFLGDLNSYTDSLPAMALAFGVIGAAVAGVTIAMWGLFAAILKTAAAQAVLDALSGNLPALAAGAAVGAAVGIGIYSYNKYNEGGANSAQERTARATERTAASIDELKGNVIGGGQRVQGTIGNLQLENALARTIAAGLG